jgi:hypothetical protein
VGRATAGERSRERVLLIRGFHEPACALTAKAHHVRGVTVELVRLYHTQLDPRPLICACEAALLRAYELSEAVLENWIDMAIVCNLLGHPSQNRPSRERKGQNCHTL